MNYSKIDLSGPTVIERSVPLPAWLDGIGASEDQIADCGWAGHDGIGFWPETVTDPALDPATETLTGEIVWAEPDEQTRTVAGERVKRALTAEEIAERQPRLPAISDRQFAQQLAILETITQAEAIAWAARGDLPDALEAAIATLPEEGGVQFAARMLLSSATTYERTRPMTATLGGILGYEPSDLDDLWRAAAAL